MPIEFSQVSPTRAVVVYAGDISDAEVMKSHERVGAFLHEARDAGLRVALLVDGSNSNGVSARQRQMMAEFNDAHASLLASHCLGQGLALTSAIQRGVLTAMLWLRKPPAPLKAFATRAEASQWLDLLEADVAA